MAKRQITEIENDWQNTYQLTDTGAVLYKDGITLDDRTFVCIEYLIPRESMEDEDGILDPLWDDYDTLTFNVYEYNQYDELGEKIGDQTTFEIV